MIRRLLALLLVGMVFLAGLAMAQDPPAKEEPPVRLKKKSRGGDKPKVDPDKPNEKKDDKKAEKKDDKKDEPREAEPVTPQEEEKEVLQRVVTNVHNVGERLAKNDLGEATQQTQRDILKDLESLIKRNENPPPQADEQNQEQGGGGDGQQDQKQKGSKAGQKKKGGKAGQKQKGQAKGSRQSGGTRQKNQRTQGSGDKPGGKNGKNGNGGGGGDQSDRARNKNADLDKHGVWGHVPASLRSQMDAFSNPQPFMPKYDDLIKRYYRTIAEQGRRKGE
jgi:hypothetical protein